MFWVYVIQSVATGRFYVGQTDDVGRRMKEHNEGLSKYTRHQRPWELIWCEGFGTRSEAMRREQEIKLRKSKKYLLQLVKSKN